MHRLLISCTLLVLGAGGTLAAAEGDRPGSEIDLLAAPAGAGDLAAWKYFGEDPQSKRGDVWQLKEGVLICKGSPRGYLYTAQSYTDFVLKLQWRIPAAAKPHCGGVLVRMSGPNKIWPKSLEAQINHPDAGDFWGLDGYRLDGPAARKKTLEHKQFGALTNLKKAEEAERPLGQWNQYEIVAVGGTVTLKINGREVNQATGCDVAAGPICLTAEGNEIHFRNVKLTLTAK
jgi:hypothetical protein